MAKGKELKTEVSIHGEVDSSLNKAVKEANKALAKVGGGAKKAGKGVSGVNKSIEDTQKKVQTSMGAIMGYVQAVGAAMVSAAGVSLQAAATYDQAQQQMQLATGATGAELEELNAIASEVYENGFGQDLSEVTAVVAELNKQLGLTGDELQEVAEYTLALSSMGYDPAETIHAANVLMQEFGVTATEAFDLMVYGIQNGADASGELLDTIQEYSVYFAELGFNAEQMMALFINGAEAGVYSVDKLADAVKEFNIRSKDMSESTMAAYEALGLSATEMTAAFAAGGAEAQEAFFQVVHALMEVEDAALQNQIAVALFGTQYEDLEAQVLPILASMEQATLDVGGAAASAVETVDQSFGNMVKGGLRTFQAEIAHVGESLKTTITNIVTEIGPELLDFGVAMVETFAPLVGIFMTMGAILIEYLLPPLTQIVEILGPPLLELFEALLPIAAMLGAALGLVAQVFATLAPILVPVIDAITVLVQLFTILLAIVAVPFKAIMDKLIELCAKVAEAFQPITDAIKNVIDAMSAALAWIREHFIEPWGELWDAIADTVVAAMSLVVYTVLSPFIAIASVLNDVIGFINDITIPDWVPVVGGSSPDIRTIPIPEIPEFASGGFTDGVSIAGEAGTEAVISFDQKYRDENIGYWQQAGIMLGVLPISGESGSDIRTIPIPDIRTISIPEIPAFASGGFTDGISIAGEAGTEAVISFSSRYREENIGYWQQAGIMLGTLPKRKNDPISQGGTVVNSGFSLSGARTSVNSTTIDLGGIQYNPQITVQGGAFDKAALMDVLREHAYEFKDLIEEIIEEQKEGVYLENSTVY